MIGKIECRGCGAWFIATRPQTVIFMDTEATTWIAAGRPSEGANQNWVSPQTEPPETSFAIETEPSSQTEPQQIGEAAETEPPNQKLSQSASQTEPPGSREQKRLRIAARILLQPDESDRAIAAEIGVSRNTVATVRDLMRRQKEKGK
jgi:hypothetical protein